jgi:hypothetical protein
MGGVKLICKIILLSSFFIIENVSSQQILPIAVASNRHYLTTTDGKPFFWLGDTAWELIHSTTLIEADYYLNTRARQGFTVIQTVVLSEFDGLTKPTPEGFLPFKDGDPSQPNNDYFLKVTEIVARAERLGLYIALVPTWGDKLTAPWGIGPRIFTLDNLSTTENYGHYLGKKLRGHKNIIWLLGGDRPALLRGMNNDYLQQMAKNAGFPSDIDWTPIWRSLAKGIKAGYGKDSLIVFHPQGGAESSSVMLPNASWLNVNGLQSGHGGGKDSPVWELIARDFAIEPSKPSLDLEPNYEDHPYNPWPRWDAATGYFDDYDVRKQTYRSVFSGGAGVSYGHHSVWPFVGERNTPINYAKMDWISALQRPGAQQMVFLRYLMESRPYLDRIPDPTLILQGQGDAEEHMVAMRDKQGSYAFIYFPQASHHAIIDLKPLKSQHINVWWYDTRTGVGRFQEELFSANQLKIKSPPYGPDWVLVIDDANKNFAPPGLTKKL